MATEPLVRRVLGVGSGEGWDIVKELKINSFVLG